MVVPYETLNNFSVLNTFLENFEPNTKLLLLFCGAPAGNLLSWCSDCVKAEPVIDAVVQENRGKNFKIAKVLVGSREEWKNPENPFRKDPRFKLTSVPTLLLWGTSQRLGDAECSSPDLVRLLFEDV